MTKIIIDKEFSNEEERQQWLNEHLTEYTNGRPVLMISNSQCIGSSKVKIENITVI